MKFYSATVTLSQVVQIGVWGLDDQTARQTAIEQARLIHPGAGAVVDVQLGLLGESQFTQGTRVMHSMFGQGEISQVEGGFGETCRVEVKFDDGQLRQLCAPHPTLRPEGP